VFWIENGAGEYRDAITEGVLMWNLAFEKVLRMPFKCSRCLITPLGTRLMCV